MPNPYDSAASDLFSGQLALGAKASVSSVADRNPDAEADTQRNARALGVPYESARNVPIGSQVATQAIDYSNLARTAPRTAQFLTSTSNAAIAHDDIGVLGGIEKGLQFLVNPLGAFGFASAQASGNMAAADVKKQGGIANYFSALGRDVSPEQIGRHVVRGALGLVSSLTGAYEGASDLTEKLDVTAGLQRRLFGGTVESGFAGLAASARRAVDQKIYGIPTSANTQTGAAIGQGIEGLTTMGAAVGLGAVTGGIAAPTALFGVTGFGHSYGAAIDEGVSQGHAAVKSAIDGIINAAAALVPESKFAGDFAEGAGAKKFILDQILTQVPAQELMTLGQDFNQWAMIDQNRGKSFADYAKEIVPHAYDALISAGVGALAVGAFGAAARGHEEVARQEERAGQAEQMTQGVEELSKLAAASKLRERDPETFKGLVDDMADGAPASDVYVAPDKLGEALFQGGFDEDKAREVDSTFGPRIKEALEQGTDVRVPIAEFTTYLAGTGAEKALIDHVKVDPSGMTRAEGEEFMATRGEALRSEIEQQLGRAQEDDVHKADLEQVRSQILDQMNQANRFTPKVNERYADLQAAFYSTIAKRMNVSPNTLYERFPLRIVNRAMPDSQDALNQRFTDLMAGFGKPPKEAAPANENAQTELGGAAGERLAALAPAHERYQEGDVLSYGGETGRVAKVNKRSVTLALPSGDKIVPRDHPDLKVAPLEAWRDEYHQTDEAPIFYSELERAVEKSAQAKASPEQWLATLSKTAGVKKEEIEWTELPEWLATQDGPVTREELLAFVRAGGVQVEEVALGGDNVILPEPGDMGLSIELNDDGDGWRIVDLDGNVLETTENYEQAERWIRQEAQDREDMHLNRGQFESYTEGGGEDYHELLLTLPPGVRGNPERSPSTHFDEPGVVAHLRFKTRSTTDGKKTLFIEEVQSDWHQKGRDQGYATPLTDDQRADLLDTVNEAERHAAVTGWALAQQTLKALEAERVRVGEVKEPEGLAFEPGSKHAESHSYLLDLALGAKDSSLRGQASALKMQDGNNPDTQRLIDYALGHAEVIRVGDVERGIKVLSKSIAEGEDGAAQGRMAARYINDLHWPNDVPVDLQEAASAYRDADLKVNETRQAMNNAGKGIPDAPFKATWPALVMKRAIRYAADNGFEAVAWTTGEQQRERYNLARSIEEIRASKTNDGRYVVNAGYGVSQELLSRGLAEPNNMGVPLMTPDQIGEVFGKDLGSRMMALADQSPNNAEVRVAGDDLKIGGEGMLAFYDRNLVNITNNILKKLGGAKVEMLPVEGMTFGPESEAASREYIRSRDEQFGGAFNTESARKDAEHWQEMAERGGPNAEEFQALADKLRNITEKDFAPLREAEQRIRELENRNPGFVITPEIASHAREGFALFQKNRGAYSPATDTISLLEHADLSTFLHESGHFFLETYSRLVEQGNAPAQIADDFNALLKWFGVKDAATWQSMGLEQRREAHEKFARAFEAYLFTGRAPAPRLRDLFRTFRSWLVAVYRHATNLGVRPTPQIRDVMDRMLATDAEIGEAQAARSMEPLFKDQATSGMSEDQWQDYQRTNATATDEATQQLGSRSLRDLRWLDNARGKEVNRLKRQADAIRKSTRARVAAEVAQEPVYRAQQFLKRGTLDGETAQGPHKLSISSVDKMLEGNPDAAEIKRKLGYGKYGMLGEEGLDAESTAQVFGFSSADHLIRTLASAEPMAERINGMAEQRLLEEHGDLTDPQSIAEAASEAVHNEFRARAVAAELAALAKATGKPRLLAQAARQFAEDTVARTRVRDIRPAKYEAAASRAAKAAMKALGEGNLQQAALEKRNQLFNIYATRGARKAQDEVTKALALFDRLTRPATAKSIDSSYRDQIVQLLDRYDLNRGTTLKEIDKRVSLAEWAERQREMGLDPVVPDEILNDTRKRSYKQLTVEELRGLVDTVKNIEHLGRLKSKLLTAKKDRDFAAATEKVAGRITGESYKTIKQPLKATRADKIKGQIAGFFADLRKLSSFAHEMDGFHGGGPVWEYFIRPLNDAGDREAMMRSTASKKITELLKPLGDMRKKLYIPEIGNSLDLEARLAIALNTGNEINRERVLSGEKWNDGQLSAVLRTLDSAHWSTVQKIWDYIGSYWPDIAAKERRVTGIEPERVEGDPIQVETADGQTLQLPGGYYPIKYNSNRSSRADGHESAEIARAMLQGAYTRATTRRGHTKARVNSTGMALRYDLGVVPEHVAQVIHDLTHHEALIDVTRLLRTSAIDGAIRDHYGPEVLRTFRKTFEAVAGGDIPAQSAIDRTINYLRSGGIAANLGLNLYVSLLHPFNLVKAARAIGPKWVGKATLRFIGDAATMNSTAKWISDHSAFMAKRSRTMFRELDEARNVIEGRSTVRTTIDQALYYLVERGQLLADIPTWLAQYEKSLDAGEEHDRAVALADQAVLRIQGGGGMKDRPDILRGGALKKLFTAFYSFANANYNLFAESVNRTKKEGVSYAPALVADTLTYVMFPAIVHMGLRTVLSGDTPKADDIEAALVNSFFALFPIARDFGPLIAGTSKDATPSGLPYEPFARLITDLKRKDTEVDERMVRDLNMAAGTLFHYPAGQIDRTARGIEAIEQGDTHNPAAILLGPPPQAQAAKHY